MQSKLREFLGSAAPKLLLAVLSVGFSLGCSCAPDPAPVETTDRVLRCSCQVDLTSTAADKVGRDSFEITTPEFCLNTDTDPDEEGANELAADQCSEHAAPWVTQLTNQIAKSRASDAACLVGVVSSVSCRPVPYGAPDGNSTRKEACADSCAAVNCEAGVNFDEEALLNGETDSIACSSPNGCSGEPAPLCQPELIGQSSSALRIAAAQGGTFDESSSTVDLSVTVPVGPFSVGGNGSAQVTGIFRLIGNPCPGKNCTLGFEFEAGASSLALEFADPVSDQVVSDIFVKGGTGSTRVSVDANGNGFFPAGALSFRASGLHDGARKYKQSTSPTPIPFHVDWETGRLAITGLAVPFESGLALVNLQGEFSPSLVWLFTGEDSDNDGIRDIDDNCPQVPNPAQELIPSPVLVLQSAPQSCSGSVTPPAAEDICFGLPVTVTSSLGTAPPLVGTSTITWTATDSQGRTATASQEITRTPTLLASNSIRIADRAVVQTGAEAVIASIGQGGVTVGTDTRVGAILSLGGIDLRDRAHILGSARSSGRISIGNQVRLDGGIFPFHAPAVGLFPELAPQSFSVGSVTVHLEPSQTASRSPGLYRSIILKSRAVLSLAPGDYFLDALQLEPQSRVVLSGKTRIFINRSAILRGSIVLQGAAEISLYYNGATQLTVEQPFDGKLVAPKALVSLGAGNALTFTGSLFAKDIEVRPDVVVTCR